MRKLIVGAGLLLAQLLASEAWPYAFTSDFRQGIYWGSFPISMKRFAVDASEGNLLQSTVESAVGAWESALGEDIWDVEGNFVVGGVPTGNYIRWSNNFAQDTGYDPQQTLAVTIRYSDGNFLQSAVIILNGQMGHLRANVGGILYKTVLHELGHTIGLDHSQVPAIMQAYIGALSVLTYDDVEGGLAVMNETRYRQSIGFAANSAGSRREESTGKMVGCGSVGIDPPFSGGGSAGPVGSFVLGLMLMGCFARTWRRGVEI